MKRSVIADDLSRSESDCGNRSFNRADFDVIANWILLFKQNEESSDDIADESLGAKTQGNADDSGAGKKRADRNAKDGQNCIQVEK